MWLFITNRTKLRKWDRIKRVYPNKRKRKSIHALKNCVKPDLRNLS